MDEARHHLAYTRLLEKMAAQLQRVGLTAGA